MTNRSPFSDDYATARDRFCGAAHAMGLRQEKLPVDVPTPYGSDLSIDVAFAGSERPSRVLIVTSGLHGVEGFFGSAIQVALLEDVLRRDGVPSGVAIVLVHALNPFGFSKIRRFDDENVDLNRNFLLRGEEFKGCPDRYAELDGLLNPRARRIKTPLSRVIGFPHQIVRDSMSERKRLKHSWPSRVTRTVSE